MIWRGQKTRLPTEYTWQEYEDKPTYGIHVNFMNPDYTDLKKFFEAVMKGPGKSE
jgi:hypothetical protein